MKKLIKKGERNYALKLIAFAMAAVALCIAAILVGAIIAKYFIE